jgi:hypothetical protein
VTDKDANTPATSTVLTSTLNLSAVNDTPTLTDFSGPLAAGGEDTEITLTYSDLIGNTGNKAQVADADGTVTSLKVDKLLSGSLRLGSSAVTATAFDPGSNDCAHRRHECLLDAGRKRQRPCARRLYSGRTLDDGGALVSIQPRSVQVAVTPDHADAASITSVVTASQRHLCPRTGARLYGQLLTGPSRWIRHKRHARAAAQPQQRRRACVATYRSGSGTDTLSFRYTVGAGDLDLDGLSLASALSLNNGTITSSDDSQPVNAGLSLSGIGSTAGLRVDGVNRRAATSVVPLLHRQLWRKRS